MTIAQGVFEWDIQDVSDALKIGVDDVMAYFTDGRRVSFLLERRIAYEVLHGTLAPSEGAGYDVIDSEGRKWEVRSVSRGRIYFCPSYMVGSRRSFDEPGFENKMEEIAGYVLSDIQQFPSIPYWSVPVATVREWWQSGKLGKTTKISREKALELLRRM